MEVMITSPVTEFNFDSACTTPYISAPSSPQRFGNFFYSAPASPTRVSGLASVGVNGGGIPFDWEEEPGIPKPKEDDDDDDDYDGDDGNGNGNGEDEFAFDFSGQLEKTSFSAADELFDGGKIKPLKPPPRFQYEGKPLDSPKSPRSPKQMIKEAFSPRHRRKDFDPFSAALERSRKDDNGSSNHRRGRERNTDPTAPRSNSRHKGTRSLSPFRVSDLLLDRDETSQENTCSSSSSSSSASVSSFISMWYRKWKLKDLLLFRSASEGRASSKELMNKYAMLKKSNLEDVKNSSFRSTESAGSTSRRRGPVSAHELHYTVNRAASEEMKRKTFLPYKQGLLGCLGFHPSTVPEISKGLASMSMPRTRQQ